MTDYWGIEEFYDKLAMEKKEALFEKSNRGFGCQTENCGNREAKCGSVFLPYCNENLVCAKKNIGYLVEQNIEQRGKITVYHNLVTSILPENTAQNNLMDDVMDEGI